MRKLLTSRQLFPVLILASGCAIALHAQTRITTTVSGPPARPSVTVNGVPNAAYHASRVLVNFHAGAPRDILPGSGPIRAFPGNSNLFLVENPPGLSVAEAVGRYRNNPNVKYAEPDYVVSAVGITPNDPLWAQQWDMLKISADVAWQTQTDSSDVVAVIIDTGIDFTHPDLKSNLWLNPADGASHGFTCAGGSCVAGGQDDYGHGTHVAGAIGAAGDNNTGIAGINWRVKLLSMKFLDSTGSGQVSDAVLAFQQVLQLKQLHPDVPMLTNNSWGGFGYSQALKDAMTAVEAAGVVNVCAAGNSFANSDVSAFFPAGFDNRGIVSVLASDAGDRGAFFTNFGLATVDIAAPGVDTLSTVPAGGCPLCDPSGYRLLSGTSMAAPHVSGVVAGLLHQHPGLNAAAVRDILLDPASYDPLTDPKASSTSTAGRLNFAHTLANPRLSSPIVLNNFPTVRITQDVAVNAGTAVAISATAADADTGDTAGIRRAWSKLVGTAGQGLIGFWLDSIFPLEPNLVAPSLARIATVPYQVSVADNRGGSAVSAVAYATVNPVPQPGGAPFGALSVSDTTPPLGSTITVNYPVIDPEHGPVAWDVELWGQGGGSSTCCFTGPAVNLNFVNFTSPAVLRIRTRAMDQELNVSEPQSVVVRLGGAVGEPPLIRAAADKLSGPVPLTVNVNYSGSSDADGTVQSYFTICDAAFTAASLTPLGSCTFTTPGPHWIMADIQDNSGQFDSVSFFVMATPAPGDSRPPSVSIATPSYGAAVVGRVSLTANAADESGIRMVEYRLGTPGGTLIGSSTAAPYAVAWDTSAAGNYVVYAVATDTAGNVGISTAVAIKAGAPIRPLVAIASPADGAVVARKSTLAISAVVTNTPTYGISRVDVLEGAKDVLCSLTAAPFKCAWVVPSANNRAYQLRAIAYDTKGVASPAATITVNVQ